MTDKKAFDIALIPGDGIGVEVTDAAWRVAEAAAAREGTTLEATPYPWSCRYYLDTGSMMPADGIDKLRRHDAVLLGAVGWPATVPDSVSLHGLLLPIRKSFDQYANVRPHRLLPGVEGPLKTAGFDILCIRENTEGEYSGAGGRVHQGTANEVAVETAIFTRAGVERILRFAFEQARARHGRLASVTKSNAQKHSMVFWDEITRTLSADYPDVEVRSFHVDAMAARMVMAPESLDVVVASNLFGDILTDLGAAIQGGLGFAASANIRSRSSQSLDVRARTRFGAGHRGAGRRQSARRDLVGGHDARSPRRGGRRRAHPSGDGRDDPRRHRYAAGIARHRSDHGRRHEEPGASAMMELKDTNLFRQQGLIGGVWTDAGGGATVEVSDPATGTVIGGIPDMGEDETRRAIAAAEAAFGDWRSRTHADRAERLLAWHDLMLAHEDDLAMILTREQGKPLAEARGEIRYGASFVRWFAEEARRIGGATIPSPTPDRRIVVLKQAVGVAAIITPWNFPNAMITRKAAPALAAGCTIVVKPSEFTPFSALALGVLAERAGIPAGVVNIVTGMPAAIGQELTASATVRKLSFTGSTRVGSLLMEKSAPTVKRLSLELGGNAPFIVFDDADIDLAVEGALASKFRNGGQTCVCSNRILVQDRVHDVFVGKLAARVSALRVGPGTQAGVDIGPMINGAALDKIHRHVDDALSKGASVASRLADLPEGPHYVAPRVLVDATTDMLLASEETFGPVAPIFRFGREAEAVEIANATPYGLAAYFYTRDLARSWRVGEALEFGMVGLNTGMVSTEVAPFGGVKQSGLGREGARCGIEEYLESKAFHIGGTRLKAPRGATGSGRAGDSRGRRRAGTRACRNVRARPASSSPRADSCSGRR